MAVLTPHLALFGELVSLVYLSKRANVKESRLKSNLMSSLADVKLWCILEYANISSHHYCLSLIALDIIEMIVTPAHLKFIYTNTLRSLFKLSIGMLFLY